MLFSEGIALFADSRQAEGFAENTIRNNTKDLTRMLAILGDLELTQLRPQHLDRVLAIEADRGLSAGSLNNIQSTLAAFSRWCRDREHMLPSQNPVGTRRYRSDPPKQRDLVPLADFPKLLNSAGSGEMGPRDRAFIACGLYLMVRQSELIRIRVKDVNLEYDEVEILIKKTKDRDTMPISSELHEELDRYLQWYRDHMGGHLDGDWYLFPAAKTSGYHQWSLQPDRMISRSQDIVRRALLKIGWKDDWIGVHVLRRSSARARLDENIEQGYDAAMREIQSWLHHSTITTTERYLQMQPDRDRRNRRTSGKPLFPSLTTDKVADVRQLRESHG